jgi:hypothetical protein
MSLLDRILLAAVRWRLAGFRQRNFAACLTKALSNEFEEQERRDKKARQAAADRALYTEAIERFTRYEETQPRLLQ